MNFRRKDAKARRKMNAKQMLLKNDLPLRLCAFAPNDHKEIQGRK